MTLTIDPVVYSSLLTEITPKVIESEAEYERTLSIVEKLTFNQKRTPEETAIYKLLVTLVEAYETENYPIPEASPNDILRHLLEASGTHQADLVGILGSNDLVLEVLNGERSISQEQAKILAKLFRVNLSLFV
ncbi:MAG: transcriptional regulator [Phormidesmis sp.]